MIRKNLHGNWEDKNMKKKTVALLLCTMSVLFASCGKTADAGNGAGENMTATEAESETVIPETEEIQTGTEADAETETDVKTETAAETKMEEKFDVTLEEINESFPADDGTVIFESTYSYPNLSSDSKKEAADAISRDIAELEQQYKTESEEIRGYAKEDYAYRLEEGTESGMEFGRFVPYESDSTSTVERNDAAIFSFVVYSYDYSGGAHGSYIYSGYNYDAATGARLLLTDLAEDADSFKQNILSNIEAQCQTDAYKDMLFPEYMECLEDALSRDTGWYLTQEGLTITCAPYELGPYSSGNIDFTISYDELGTYGIKSAYLYQAD